MMKNEMKKSVLGIGLALVLATLAGTGDAQAKDMQGWRVAGDGTGIVENQWYSLLNLDQGQYLAFS